MSEAKRKNFWQLNRNGSPLKEFPTPPHITEALLSRERFRGSILEPAAGSGLMSRVLRKHGYRVRATDIKRGHDFLKRRATAENVITNPPYSRGMAEQFVRKAMEITERKIAMLMPTYFTETARRHELFTDPDFPVKSVYFISRRPKFVGEESGSPFGVVWIVWDRDWKSKSETDWIL